MGEADDEVLSFAGRRLDDADFSNARLHSPNFEATRVTDAWLRGADVSGYIEGMRVNGVEIAPLVEAELDRRSPERVKLRAADPEGLAEAWAMIESIWESAVARARALPEHKLHERVDGEWSFVETLRHLVMATDSWLYRMVLQVPRPYHQWGLAGSFLRDPEALGIEPDAKPSLADILEVRQDRMETVASTIRGLTPAELERVCIPSGPGHPSEEHTVLHCLHVILDEEWEHCHYATRDLDILHPANDGPSRPGSSS